MKKNRRTSGAEARGVQAGKPPKLEIVSGTPRPAAQTMNEQLARQERAGRRATSSICDGCTPGTRSGRLAAWSRGRSSARMASHTAPKTFDTRT